MAPVLEPIKEYKECIEASLAEDKDQEKVGS